MKTIIRTLTTIALVSAIQCGWTSEAGSEDDNPFEFDMDRIMYVGYMNNIFRTYVDYDEKTNTYTLRKPSIYDEDDDEYKEYIGYYISEEAYPQLKENLVIPEGVTLEHVSSNYFAIGEYYSTYGAILDNYGGFTVSHLALNGNSQLINHGICRTGSISLSGSSQFIHSSNTALLISDLYLGGNSQFINNATVSTGNDYRFVCLEGSSQLVNHGTFNSRCYISLKGISQLENSISEGGSNSVTFTNRYRICVDADGSNVTINNGADATFINNGTIYFDDTNCNITFDGTGEFINSGTSSKSGQIYLNKSGSSITINSDTTLTFGDYGKFYIADNNNHDVTLDGSIAIKSSSASVNLKKMNISGSGTIDMSKIQECSDDVNLQNPLRLSAPVFTCGTSQQLPNIKLPFYCKFNGIDLSNAAKVYYTILKKGNTAKIEGGIIMLGDQVTDEDVTETYGDYATQSLGVTLPEESKRTVTTQYAKLMSLSYVANNENTYNEPEKDYKLNTTDLTDATDSIATDATRTYNFGFIGTTPIEISGNGKAVFMGDNSGYTPKDEDDSPVEITLPNNVEFAANKSLFQFAQTYVKGTFSAGNYTNLNFG